MTSHAQFNHRQRQVSPKDVLKELNELFGNVLQIDIIKSVASSCNFDVSRSSNVLIELAGGPNSAPKKPRKNGSNKTSPAKKPPSPKTNNNNRNNTPKIQHSFSTSSISNKSRKQCEIERVISIVRNGYKVLVILRGMPGSGKSHLAKNIIDSSLPPTNYRHHILSTDDFFLDRGGFYTYDPNKLSDAHGWNHQRAFHAINKGLSPVIIDNTNTQMWEMKPYAMMAIDCGYYIEILEPDTWWCFNDKELAKRNTHTVPKAKIKEMIERYEKNITPQKLLMAYSLQYKFQKPPQFRLVPPLCPPKTKSMVFISDTGPDLIDFDNQNGQQKQQRHQRQALSLIDKPVNGDDTNILQPQNSNNNNGKVDDNVESAWGINEKALQSWDIVTPLNEELAPFPTIKFDDDVILLTETSESSTNTEPLDFNVGKNGYVPDGFTIKTTSNRDINFGLLPKPLNIPKKIKVDQSSLTEEQIEVHNNLQDLITLFPHIPKSHLIDIYDKCKKDFNWAVEVLLEDNNHTILEEKPIVIMSSSSESTDDLDNNVDDEEDDDYVSDKKTKKPISEEALQLKKCLESKIDINKEHYSNHVLRVKKQKFGLSENVENGPSTSYKIDDSDDDFEHIEMDDFENMNPKHTVELNLGESFVDQLETLFGNITPKGFQPIVQIPQNLALQLYTFYVESVYQQMENQNQVLQSLIKEDEEFAKKLQRQEEEQQKAIPQAPEVNLNEIMDEQMALNIYQRDSEKWKDLTADNLAAKLTRQKLFSIFPMIEQNTLVEILHAYDNNYNKTVEVLLASTGMEAVNMPQEIIKEPPISESTIKEMKEDEKTIVIDDDDEEGEEEEEGGTRPATYYREAANKHLKQRQDLYSKAQNYYQRGMLEVAQFYSELAKKETNLYDRANSLAATAFLDENSRRLQKFDTIDLHFLFVKEAVNALDVFIDSNINVLRNGRELSQYLMIITGRGNNSAGGISKIKPAVIKRLKKRKIGVSWLNPGLLKIKVTRHTLMCHELQ